MNDFYPMACSIDINVDKDIREYSFGVDGWTWDMWDKVKAEHPNEYRLWLQVNGSQALTDDEFMDDSYTVPSGIQFQEARMDMMDPIEPMCHLHFPWSGMPGSMSAANNIRKHLNATTYLLEVHVKIHREEPRWRAMDTIKRQFMESIKHLCYVSFVYYYIKDTCTDQVKEIMNAYNNQLCGQATITVLLSKLL